MNENPCTMSEGYIQQRYQVATKRYVQILDLRDDPELIAEYRKWHSKEFHWDEIREGIRSVGILEMEIYIRGNHLVMIVDTPVNFDWAEAMSRLSALPRQAEWEAFVAKMQGVDPNARSDEKWQMTERMFRLY